MWGSLTLAPTTTTTTTTTVPCLLHHFSFLFSFLHFLSSSLLVIFRCTLSRFTEFLLSTLLQRISLDAGESPQASPYFSSLYRFSHLTLSSTLSLHISRGDAFLVVQEALSAAVSM